MIDHTGVKVHLYGWLLLTPAAILLIAFTHYPTFATLSHSLFSTGTATRPAEFIGIENYRFLLEDEVFWKVVRNNVWYAVGTIPLSIAIAVPPVTLAPARMLAVGTSERSTSANVIVPVASAGSASSGTIPCFRASRFASFCRAFSRRFCSR